MTNSNHYGEGIKIIKRWRVTLLDTMITAGNSKHIIVDRYLLPPVNCNNGNGNGSGAPHLHVPSALLYRYNIARVEQNGTLLGIARR